MTPKTEISFTVDKHGNALAYRYSRAQMRNFRIAYDDAKLRIATGDAIETPYRPLQDRRK